MNYPQQQPAYEPPPAPVARAKRWPWILGIVAAFIVGALAGTGAANDKAADPVRETVTVGVPAPDDGAAPAPPAEQPAGPATTMGSGVYQVGVDVQSGQYKTAGPDDSSIMPHCYWARLKDDSGNFEALIANDNLEGPGSVTINDGEFFEASGDCTWTKVG